MGQIFISYSRRDTEIVDQIAAKLEQAGLDVWIDRQAIKAGNTWRVQIVQAIDTCLAFVLMLSPNSAASDNVRREIDLAQDIDDPFLPLMLEPVKIPPEIRYQLAGQQLIDVQMVGLDNAISQPIEAIQEHIKALQPAEEPATRQVELVIQGIDLKDLTPEKQEQLLDFLAQISDSDRSKLQLTNLAPGSVHAFVDMPSISAYTLKTMALNRDSRLKQFGIVSLRLDGDTRYVNTNLGIPTQTANLNLLQTIWHKTPPLLRSTFGVTTGRFLTVLLIVLILTGAGFAAAQSFSAPAPLPLATSTPTITQPAPTTQPTSTFTAPPPIETLTLTVTATPAFTHTPTSTITPTPTFSTFTGTVHLEAGESLACRYGPGQAYLNKWSLIDGNQLQVLGRADTSLGPWVYVKFDEIECWISANPQYVQLSGDISSLEMYYPGNPDKFKLLSFSHPNFKAPQNIEANRRLGQPDQIDITWVGQELAPGDREGPNRPLYLLEVWTCQGGKLVFTPIGTIAPNALITDEAGCSQPSHGRVYLAHKDGYVGPVEIPWPAYPTATP